MNSFARKFLTEWRKLKLPFEGETFVAAVSGGADSVALLLALEELRTRKKLKNPIVVAHFNHGLRGKESEKDAEFVADLAGKFGFEFVCKTAAIVAQKGNLEQNARNARYRFLRETVENYKAFGVLTAHTLNDQAETFLLNLIRGSGLEGLSGMKAIRPFDTVTRRRGDAEKSQILLVRPLLAWAKRGDTEDFCHLKKIEYRTDSMNRDEAFARVRIRKKLLPFLEDLNPKIVEILAKTASILREDFEELQEIAEGKTSEVKNSSAANELQLKEIKSLTPSARSRVLRAWLKTNRGNLRRLGAKHFEAVERLIFSRKSGKTVELPNRETIVKENGRLIFQHENIENVEQ